jgi:hypothetical protein
MPEATSSPDSAPATVLTAAQAMTTPASPSLARALLLPILIAAALLALLFRPASAPKLGVRPPLPTPMQLDQLVPVTAQPPVSDPGQAPSNAEGLRSLRGP